MKLLLGIVISLFSMNVFASSGAAVGPNISFSSGTGSLTVVPFTTSDAECDTGNYIGTNLFTVPVDGIYVVTVHGVYHNTGAADIFTWGYQINSGTIIGLSNMYVPSGFYMHNNVSFQQKLSRGDTVKIYSLINNGGNID